MDGWAIPQSNSGGDSEGRSYKIDFSGQLGTKLHGCLSSPMIQRAAESLKNRSTATKTSSEDAFSPDEANRARLIVSKQLHNLPRRYCQKFKGLSDTTCQCLPVAAHISKFSATASPTQRLQRDG
ncbi:unnamed protein product [Toxocara canis]|uniref:Uncharacterized protein n=1 Tax=Toxocara canis TaxID=6265 RepID=A0A183TXQ2_TOXCA|nr:unnamed protein product [Toxocara canis]